jgi:hypothetical protein
MNVQPQHAHPVGPHIRQKKPEALFQGAEMPMLCKNLDEIYEKRFKGSEVIFFKAKVQLQSPRSSPGSSQVNTLPKAKSETRSKQNKDMHKCSSVYSERGVPLPVLTSGGE